MDKSQKELIDILVSELNKYCLEYYTMDNPSVSDDYYDDRYFKLSALEKETGYIRTDSPTQRVGDRILPGFEKVRHENKLWSLNKIFSYNDLKSWDEYVKDFISDYNKNHKEKLPEPKYVLMKKLDGLTIESVFSKLEENSNSVLTLSSTRGQDGIIGEVITEQSKTFINLPHEIPYMGKISVHGEALMTKKAFEKYNKKAVSDGRDPLKNLRNGAAGAVRNLNIAECAKRKIMIEYYDITKSEEHFETLSEKLDFIQKLGLPCTWYQVYNTMDEIMTEINRIGDKRSSLPYDIDGAVVKINNLRTCELMSYTVKYPRFGRAYKFQSETAVTKLVNVEFNVGRSGRVTPRAKLQPVNLGKKVVQYATLNNEEFMLKKGLKIGCDVLIKNAGDVIPELVDVVEESLSRTNLKDVEFPKTCPSCGSTLLKDGAFYICENTLGCKPQLVKTIVHFCEKQAMNIEGFSEKAAESFVENKIIESFIDMYSLEDKKHMIISLNKFGEKKYQNLIKSVEKSKICDLHQLLYGLGIPEVGIKTAKDIVNQFKSLDAIRRASIEDLKMVEDVGYIIAKSIFNWFRNEDNAVVLDTLLSIIKIKEISEQNSLKNPFSGKTIVTTGTLKGYTRTGIIEKLESLGAKITGSVSKKTDFVLVGDNPGSKYTKAIKLDIPILSEEKFENMLKISPDENLKPEIILLDEKHDKPFDLLQSKSNSTTALDGQISLFELPLNKGKKESNSLVVAPDKSSNITFSEDVSLKQQKIIDALEKDNCISRIILYKKGAIGIEIKKNTGYITHYINAKGIDEFILNKKSSVLPWDKILYYNPEIDYINPSEKQLKELNVLLRTDKNRIKRIIKRKGDENILVEMVNQIISINPIGWVLPFNNITKIDCKDSEIFK